MTKNTKIARKRTYNQRNKRRLNIKRASFLCELLNTTKEHQSLYKRMNLFRDEIYFIANCKYCEKYYPLTRANRMYCSDSCRVRSSVSNTPIS